MGLYHFFWKGKERAVSVSRLDHFLVSLSFVDDEISKNVNAHLLIEKNESGLSYLNEKEIVSLQEADELIASIEKAIGHPIGGWFPVAAK